MSETHLPDDFATWPKDPYQLLEVPANVDRRALRTAYTNLIRQYKPERFPEQFQVLRQAYEQLLQRVKWREQFEAAEAEDESDGDAKTSAGSPLVPEVVDDVHPDASAESADSSTNGDQPHDAPLRPLVVPLADELDQLWQRTCDGEEQAAYYRLVELEHQYPGNADICIRLYWLLVVAPEVQSGRSPCDWLVAGLAASRLRGPLMELYRREVQREPAEITSGRYHRLMQVTDDPATLANLVEIRWLAAGKLRRWDLIAIDLAQLRPRIAFASEEVWGRLLLAACDQLAWATEQRDRNVFAEVTKEIDGLHHVLTSLRRHLDRLDLLTAISTGWTKFVPQSTVAESFHAFIPLTWNGTRIELQRALTPLVQSLLSQPHEALIIFDSVWSVSRAMLAHFGDSLPALHSEDFNVPEDPRGSDVIRGLAGNLIEQHRERTYANFRPILLRWCLREALSPEQIAIAIAGAPDYGIRGTPDLADALISDVPLRIVCNMQREFCA